MPRNDLLRKLCIICLAVSVFAMQRAFGAPIFAITQDANANEAGPSDVFTVGYEIVIGSQDLTITSLGMWDGDAIDGLAASHQVGIWTNSGTLLGSVTVPSGKESAKINEYRYVELASPLTLSVGEHYRVGAQVKGDLYHQSLADDYTDSGGSTTDQIDPDWPVFTPDVTYVQRWALAGEGLNFPTASNVAVSSAWDAPNFTNVALPEPASIAVLALSGLKLLWRRRRR